MVRFSTIATVAAAAILAACHGGNAIPSTANACAVKTQPSFTNLPQNGAPALQHGAVGPQLVTAARLGLWPRKGPAIRVCGNVGKGFARCQAWLRTDVKGQLRPNTPGGYAPSDLQTAYGLAGASATNGSGRTVAVVDAYDDPTVEADLSVYRSHFGLPACSSAGGCLTVQKYTSQSNAGWSGEESVDVDMISAVCPNCKILVVEAASSSLADLSTAEKYATTHADFVSNSWSGDEGTNVYDADFTASCAAITAATGDNGHNTTAQWPAVLPNVIAVGGTSLTSVTPRAETAWVQAGSACSKLYAKPSYQAGLTTGCTMRAQADVAADADPHTGVAAYDTFHHSGWLVFGGTSVAAPIVASALALSGSTSANLPADLYSHASGFNDVVSGGNGACGAPLCLAGRGWDGPTGLGTPNGISSW